MKTIKMAFLGGAALSVLSVGAQADDLNDLKAQIEALNARVAQMEAAPAVPAGYSLLTISETARPETPGLPLTARERAGYGDTATKISVLPTADAPATTTITWSGYARAALRYTDSDGEVKIRGRYYYTNGTESAWGNVYARGARLDPITAPGGLSTTAYADSFWRILGSGEPSYGTTISGILLAGDVGGPAFLTNPTSVAGSAPGLPTVSTTYLDANYAVLGGSYGDDDIDVPARGQIRVNASTDTAVGEVGVDIRMRANFDGNGAGDVYSDVAWGYWAMTPELTFGGGYAGSLGNVGYGYDGACTCYYTDNADVAFNPGDTTQLRLSYASGPFSMGIALEDASVNTGFFGDDSNVNLNDDALGVAGEIKYASDMFSGEISGVWRDVDSDYVDNLWQVGAGVGFSWDMFALSIGAAMGSGPYTTTDEGNIVGLLPIEQDWWGVSALAAFNFNDAWHAEVGAGYKNRESDGQDLAAFFNEGVQGFAIGPQAWTSSGVDYDTFAVLGGIYYDPVPQLTLGLEAEWYTTEESFSVENSVPAAVAAAGSPAANGQLINGGEISVNNEVDNFSVDFVAVWRF